MIFSVHNPYTGAFDYFEGGPETALNDDLPTPELGRSKVGVAASAAGRPLPPGARKVGSGQLPVGSVSSGKVGLWRSKAKGGVPSGISGFTSTDPTYVKLAAALGAVVLVGLGVYLVASSSADDPGLEYDRMRRRM